MPSLSAIKLPGLDMEQIKRVMTFSYTGVTFDNVFYANTLIGLAVGLISLLVQNDNIDYAPFLSSFPYFESIFFESSPITFIGIGVQFIEKMY